MAKKENIIELKPKSSSIIMLVNQYTEKLKKHLETGKNKPNPQFFMEKYTERNKKDELRGQLNMTTLLTLYGREQQQKIEKILENSSFIKASKRKFIKNIKKAVEIK
jgi:hypothetical protein